MGIGVSEKHNYHRLFFLFFSRYSVGCFLQAKDGVPAGMAHFGKRDQPARVEFETLVHIDTAKSGLDIGHGGNAVE